MKVICIDDSVLIVSREGIGIPPDKLVYGAVYNVIGVVNSNGKSYYHLEEFPFCCFNVKRFSPLSDIDETELVNQRTEKQLI